MAQKRNHSSTTASDQGEVYQSDPIHDRASIFVGLFSPTIHWKQLQQHKTVADAAHRIAAWRLPSKQRTLANSFAATGSFANGGVGKFDIGHDDDGEKGAGIKLGRLLEQEGVVGHVVVGRWWGGVMLGPVRFTWIENVAKEAIVRWTASTGGSSLQHQKRVKTETAVAAAQDGRSRQELIDELQRRDANIVVLRELLREKKNKLEQSSGSPSKASATASPAAKAPDYSTLPIARLLALDKARDATMGYILRDLDKVDKAQREEDELDAAFEKVGDEHENKVDEAAFEEMARLEREEKSRDAEEDEEAFEEMARIAQEIEQQNADATDKDTPRTPKRQTKPG